MPVSLEVVESFFSAMAGRQVTVVCEAKMPPVLDQNGTVNKDLHIQMYVDTESQPWHIVHVRADRCKQLENLPDRPTEQAGMSIQMAAHESTHIWLNDHMGEEIAWSENITECTAWANRYKALKLWKMPKSANATLIAGMAWDHANTPLSYHRGCMNTNHV